MSSRVTPSQTAGPFLHLGLTQRRSFVEGASLDPAATPIRLLCRVLDENGEPVDDAVLEIWQANAAGKYCHPDDFQDKPLDPAFTGFSRVATDATGSCIVETIKPGQLPGPEGMLQAPHLNVAIFARGLLKHLVTRIYFFGDPTNDEDPVLNLVPEDRRETLMARPHPNDSSVWHFEIRLRGSQETVFFDV
jgi:protocatechuate 3,4-dioxygenase alpha subunit